MARRRGRQKRRRGATPQREPSPTSRRYAQTQLRVARTLTRIREGESASAAAGAEGTTLRTLHRHAGSALRKTESGRYRATPSDRLPRPMRFLTPRGLDTITTRSARTASRIGEYWHAVKHYYDTGDTRRLRPFERTPLQVGREQIPFVTDPRILERLRAAGEIRFEDIYESQV